MVKEESTKYPEAKGERPVGAEVEQPLLKVEQPPVKDAVAENKKVHEQVEAVVKETKEKAKTALERMPKKYMIELKGKEYITHKGLLWLAHDISGGMFDIDSKILARDFDKKTAVVQATVSMFRAGGRMCSYRAHGVAVGVDLQPHLRNDFISMAETRAINRALRLATNCGMTSAEEVSDGKSK